MNKKTVIVVLAFVVAAIGAATIAAPYITCEKIKRMPKGERIGLAWKIARGKT